MAITKSIITDKIEVLGEYKQIQCREATIIYEDGVELSRSITNRHVLVPSRCQHNLDSDGVRDGTFTHTDTDISGEPAETQAICVAVWTDAVKAAWKTWGEANTL
jgi:hypothetical protein